MEAMWWLLGVGTIIGAIILARYASRPAAEANPASLSDADHTTVAIPRSNDTTSGRQPASRWRVSLTEQQAAFAEAAIEFYGREFPKLRSMFAVDGRSLTMPDDPNIRSDFVHKGVWQVEIGLEKMKAAGDITSARMASLRRSLLHLEYRVFDPEWYKGKRI